MSVEFYMEGCNMFIDSHLHLTQKDYEDTIDKVINDAKDNSVNYLVVSCCEMNDLEESLQLLNRKEVFLALGLHPQEAKIYTVEDIKTIGKLAKENDKIIAIGEIGLDFYYGKEDKKEQIELFEKQLSLAEALNLPVVIHTREATEDTINILKKYNVKGVIHCFSGSIETARIYKSLGFKIGIGGVVTFKNSNLPNVVKDLELSDILLETDSPYLSPEPYRGKKNGPKNIPIIAQKVAEIKNVDLKTVGEITTSNVVDLFDLKGLL